MSLCVDRGRDDKEKRQVRQSIEKSHFADAIAVSQWMYTEVALYAVSRKRSHTLSAPVVQSDAPAGKSVFFDLGYAISPSNCLRRTRVFLVPGASSFYSTGSRTCGGK